MKAPISSKRAMLAAAPVQAQERKPLSEEEISKVWDSIDLSNGYPISRAGKQFARAIEAKIKELKS